MLHKLAFERANPYSSTLYTVLLWSTSPDTKAAFSSSPVFLLRSSLASFPLLAVGVFSIVSRVGWFAVSGSVKHSKPHRRALAPITAKGNRRWTLSYNRYDENYFPKNKAEIYSYL